MPIAWDDDEAWILRTEQPLHGCAPPYVGNGRIGLRLGALVLGTDEEAPPLKNARAERCLVGTPRFDHSYPLQSFAAHGRDGFQHCMPSWANIDLRVGGQRFWPHGLTTSSNRPLATWLDLRTGEAGLDGVWRLRGVGVAMRARLLIPRTHPHCGYWELEIDGLEKPAELSFGLNGAHLLGDLVQSYELGSEHDLIGMATTRGRQRSLGFGLRWGFDSKDAVQASVDLATPGAAIVRAVVTGRRFRLRVFHSIRGGTEPFDRRDVINDLNAIESGIEDGSVRLDNAAIWRKLWASALDVTKLPLDIRDQKFILAQQFYLLASYDGSSHPTAPLGLSDNQWGGQMLWDTDLWHFRGLNALWPALARQPIRARLAMLPGAKRHAQSLGLKGAWFGWMCDEEGNECAGGHYLNEIHVNAWIALAAWESAERSDDAAWLAEVFPILSGIAEGICSRANRSVDGKWHVRDVLPPDEAVGEDPANPGKCTDDVATNLAFAAALRAAGAAAMKLGRDVPKLWMEVADGLVILPPGKNGIIPEYDGYNGHNVKQADLILAFYPLNHQQPREIVQANLDYYRERVMWGPLMTDQVEGCVRLRAGIGERNGVLSELIQRYRRFVRGAFEVPYECVDNSNSLMLTACGGLIQTFVYGWFGEPANVPRVGCD